MQFISKKLVAILVLSTSVVAGLGACAPLIVGGAVIGSLMATDRRTSGIQIEDESIELRGASRLRENLGDRAHINISSYNRQVLLTGEVPSPQDKQLAEQVVSRVENVRAIVNELSVLGNATFTQRSSDTLVTGRVKAALLDDKELFSNAFKVVTERGTTYLMGRVTQREGNRATDIARATSGVQKVVRIFEFISDDELANMLPTPVDADPKK